MLRTKQLGTLSQCARSFYLSGSRSGTADGAPYTEDETCVSKRQTKRTIQQNKFDAVDNNSAVSGSQNSLNPNVSDGHLASKYSSTNEHVVSSRSSLKPGSGSLDSKTGDGGQASLNNMQYPSRGTSGRFLKPATPTVGMYSDFVSYRIVPKDTETKKDVDVSAQPSSVSSTTSIQHGRAKFTKSQPNLTGNSSRGSNAIANQNHYGDRTSESTYFKAKCNVPVVLAQGTHSDTKTQRHCVPQRHKSRSDGKPGGRMSENEKTDAATENFGSSKRINNPIRPANFNRKSASSNRPVNGGCAVEEYYQTLQRLRWGPKTEETLDNLHFKLDPFQANQVLKLLHDPAVALGFFRWLNCQPGFKHDEHTYTTMIGVLGQAMEFEAMKRLLEDMVRVGCQPTVVTYNRIIHAYGRANYLAEAVKVFQEMKVAGYKPDRVTYCTLIDIHAKAGYLDVALDLYQMMQEVGLKPDTFTYSAMVNCLGKGGQLSSAYKLFCEMIEQGCVPNLVTYNIMIALQAKARNYPCAVKIYRDMQGAGFRPDKITYSIVMEVLGNCGHLDEAEVVFNEMSKDWVPDEPVYGLLVDMWGKSGNVDRARGWYLAMLDAGLRPNVPTCNSLLSAFLKLHRFTEARDVLTNMLRMGLIPSLQTYTLLLSCYTDAQYSRSLCCQLMAITGHPAHTFLLSLPDAAPGGENVRAHAGYFFDLVHSEDRESKRGLVDAVINFLHKSGLKEEAGFVWEVAAERNVYPDSVTEKRSSYWLINLHVMSEGTAVTALSRTLAWFQRQLLTSGMRPSRIDIITGWGRRSRVTGSSLVRQTVQELLDLFQFPFAKQNGNSGCFIGCGEALNRWLLNSYIERMHLL